MRKAAPSKSILIQCGNSQNFLRQICKIFVTLGLKILRLLRQKIVFNQISLKVDVNYCKNHKLLIFYE